MMAALTPGELRSLVDLSLAEAQQRRVRVTSVGRVCSQPGGQVGARDMSVWVRLVAKGLVTGGDGHLRLTADGMRALGYQRGEVA